MKGIVFGGNNDKFSITEMFGDGLDGALNLAVTQPVITVPLVADPSPLLDRDNATSVTIPSGTGNTSYTRIVADFDFGEPIAVPEWLFKNMYSNVNTTVRIAVAGSNDGTTWSNRISAWYLNTIASQDYTKTCTGSYRYWRVYHYGGAGIIYVSGIYPLGWIKNAQVIPSILNGPLVVKQYDSINIDFGASLTLENPCRGLVLYCKGDVSINGILSVSRKGGLSTPEFYGIDLPYDPSDVKIGKIHTITRQDILKFVGGSGGNGGNGGDQMSTYGFGGYGGGGRWLAGGYGGGGGAGGKGNTNAIGNGGSITDNEDMTTGTYGPVQTVTTVSTSKPGTDGTQGGGGSGMAYQGAVGGGTVTAGRGGLRYGGGGGGGGIAYYHNYGSGGNGGNGEYAGGFIAIFAEGNIYIGPTGVIEADGGKGGNGGNSRAFTSDAASGFSTCSGAGGGGGAGGGVILLANKGSFTNSGTISAAGGSGGSGGTGFTDTSGTTGNAGLSGSAGSVGSINIVQL